MNRARRRRHSRNLLLLALKAMDDLDSRRDFDWFVCRQVRYWEAQQAQVYEKNGMHLRYGYFDVHRWDDICYLVRMQVAQYLSEKLINETNALKPAHVIDFGRFLKTAMMLVCNRMFRELADEITDLGLPVYEQRTS